MADPKGRIPGLTDEQQAEFDRQVKIFRAKVTETIRKKEKGKPPEIPKLELQMIGLTVETKRELEKRKKELEAEAAKCIRGIDQDLKWTN